MKKRNAIAVIIVLFICVAVYLNWSTTDVEEDKKRIQNSLGSSNVVVDDDVSGITEAGSVRSDATETNGVTVESADGNINEYFSVARMEKQKARDTAITTLKESVGDENLSQASRDSAAKSIETISTSAISETRIETLVKAKGFEDCIALINDSGVNVIVTSPSGGINAVDTNKIKDIAVAETSLLPSQIKVIEIR